MADTVGQAQFMGRDGMPFSASLFFDTNGAAGTYIPIDPNIVAVTGSPENLRINKDCYLVDLIAGPATGTIEIVSNGRRTGIVMDLAHRGVTNAARPVLRVPLARGTDFRLLVTAVLPA